MSLTGIWTNELRSVMLLREDADGGLTGIYHSIVGRDPGYRALAGRTSPDDSGKQMVAFAVCFKIDAPSDGYGHYSVCGWSGWSETDDDDTLVMKTHWLLSVNLLDSKDEWAATNVGEDTLVQLTGAPDESLLRDIDALKALHSKILGEG
jgi:hypothetical protein